MIFRALEAKNDLVRSWNRPDRPFFAAGACHILAAVFLETYPDSGYHPFLIKPAKGHRGSHVAVTNGTTVFDYHGYTDAGLHLDHYLAKIRRFFPDWRGDIIALDESPAGEDFCRVHRHRTPEQYLHDPRPRALAFLKRFSVPLTVGAPLLHTT